MRTPVLLLQFLALLLTTTLSASTTSAPTNSARAGINARLFRYPHVSATQIAFVYAGDIWVAPKAGGYAQRLSSPKDRLQRKL